MALADLMNSLITSGGHSQAERLQAALDKHYVDVDERSSKDFLLATQALAAQVNFYDADIASPSGDWSVFFNYSDEQLDALLADNSGKTTPHLALLIAFLKLYRRPQAAMNEITGRCLNFYYRDVLRFNPHAAVADRASLQIELKPNAAPTLLAKQTQFTAGKDAIGVERLYQVTRDTIINKASVAELRSMFVNPEGMGSIHYAPIANSADGLGTELADDQSWPAFGGDHLPQAEFGFALASPVLLMAQGRRQVSIEFSLTSKSGQAISSSAFEQAFELYVSGAKGWLGPYKVTAAFVATKLRLSFDVPADEDAIVAYDAKIHGSHYTTEHPLVQFRLGANGQSVGYETFSHIELQTVKIAADVSDVTQLTLANDLGDLSAANAFAPFGNQATLGSRFYIAYPEALSKKLTKLSIDLQWKDAPVNFTTHYNNYGVSGINNSYFTARVQFNDAGNWQFTKNGQTLFNSGNASNKHSIEFTHSASATSSAISVGYTMASLKTINTYWSGNKYAALSNQYPLYRYLPAKSIPSGDPRLGNICLTLEKDFLHTNYRKKFAENALKYGKGEITSLPSLNEPYAPWIQSLSLSYQAVSDTIKIHSTTLSDFANSDVEFFHVAYFGQMREHAYQRTQIPFLKDTTVSLLPNIDSRGEFLIGFADLNPGDSVNVLFQVLPGSADPDLPQEAIEWSVLSDNYWQALDSQSVLFDSSNQLLQSGTIQFVIPTSATTHNTLMPDNRLWLRGRLQNNVASVCHLLDVRANVVTAEFLDQGNDPTHLSTPLAAGSISKLKLSNSAIKKIQQPYASSGGKQAEAPESFNTRASERLRHKDRAISQWDYEHLVLQYFPNIHRVKCVPHSNGTCYTTPGHVLLVVIPDLTNQNAVNKLEPKVDANTIDLVKELLASRTGPQVKLHVSNARFQPVQIECKLQFRKGFEFNYYRQQLEQALIEYLSPWIKGQNELHFGAKIYRSALIHFIEQQASVDYLTDFKLLSKSRIDGPIENVSVACPLTPDTILVSANTHVINPVAQAMAGS